MNIQNICQHISTFENNKRRQVRNNTYWNKPILYQIYSKFGIVIVVPLRPFMGYVWAMDSPVENIICDLKTRLMMMAHV